MAEIQGLTLDAKTIDNKIWVQNSARPLGTYTCFASEGDNTSWPTLVGGGQRIMNHHEVGDSTVNVLYVDFNTVENITYMQEGYGLWSNAYYDTLTLEAVPAVTPYTAGTNTFFNLYNGYLILPAAGDGPINVQPQDIRLVEIPFSIDNPKKRQAPAFWNAVYDTTAHAFTSISPAPAGDGAYNIFGAEVVLQKPVNMLLIGSGNILLKSEDIAQIAHGVRLRFTFKTDTITDRTDHEWQITIVLRMHRKYSCDF